MLAQVMEGLKTLTSDARTVSSDRLIVSVVISESPAVLLAPVL